MKRFILAVVLTFAASPVFAADFAGTATGAELNFMSGVTSAVQTQLNAKLAASALDDTKGNGDTTFIYSADKVFDLLALKSPLISPSFTTPTLGAALGTSLTLGVASTTTGLFNLYNSSAAHPFGLFAEGSAVPSIGWRFPAAMAVADSFVTVNSSGYLGYSALANYLAATKVGTVTNTKYCVGDGSGNIQCTSDGTGGGTISDTAYDATTWDGDTTAAPSKNAVRDVLESKLPTGSDGTYGLILTNNTTRSPTAATDEMYFEANIAKVNQNGTEASVVIGPTGGQVTIAGPTQARTMTVPDAAFTAARTDSGQTFTGVQVMTAPVLASPQLVITTSGLTQDKVYYRTSGDAWAEADANGSGTYPARCYAISTTQCMLSGVYTKSSHGFTIGADIYLSASVGTVTTTIPATSGDNVQKIGWALDANTLVIAISPNFGTVQ